ncbi:hypothetical protein C490_13486 [Natronobacterium gregoryi SP2]|uniref:DUF7344 domain-containing protein n=1 Tax=Natronobacterium gregoryi (strain ATCC 43098 / DSM 3393 / CCM 3738 / CIP 104747 / IAM 13177 / JCM 8860 / NBRC 102187 / NCIMB 2189 / SP2) TaxID=797304 RepID=L9XVJ4_NATGS|nr:hypothetical protein C490_13486 [Natronobacterium gregoryi SP2]
MGSTPSLDCVFDLLSDRRRRYALYYLHERDDGVATIDELTNYVAALEARVDSDSETGTESEGAEADRKQRIRTELQHVHLPKLEEVGVLEQDQRSETARYWTQPSIEEWLEHARHKEL